MDQPPDGVVDHEVHQDFLMHHSRGFAAQHIHAHGRFYVSEKQFRFPAAQVQQSDFFGRVGFGIQTRCDDEEGFRPEAGMINHDPNLSQLHGPRQHRPLLARVAGTLVPIIRLLPFDQQIIASDLFYALCCSGRGAARKCQYAVHAQLK